MIVKHSLLRHDHIIKPIMWFFIIAIIHGCAGEDKKEGLTTDKEGLSQAISSPLQVHSPQNGNRITRGEDIQVNFTRRIDTLQIDSIALYLNNKLKQTTVQYSASFTLPTSEAELGENNLKLRSYINDKFYDQVISMVILSNVEPVTYSYKVLNTFPHGIDVYTQGLVYEEGYLYESGGQYGKSTVRKIVPATGELIKVLKLDDAFFAEGLAVIEDKLIQLTWREQTAFVYDKENFTLINRLNFPVMEGWGLTYNGENLVMSDGSPTLYFLNPQYFTEERRLSVYTHAGPVNRLNELEYYKGFIFANVYGEDYIVIIDQTDGTVIGKVDFTGLLKEEDKDATTDVLNGIAINPENNHLFITGKYWPKLFEIQLLGFDFDR